MVALVIENKGKFTVITKSFTIFEHFIFLSLSMLSKGSKLGERERERPMETRRSWVQPLHSAVEYSELRNIYMKYIIKAVMGSTPTFHSGI